MSISSSLANALSGLTASARAAQVVSSNVSNAMTEGYARRELMLSARVTVGIGSGVQVDGVRRVVDEALLSDRRLADATLGQAGAQSKYLEQLQAALGLPDEPGSLDAAVAAFDASLIEASSKPDSDVRLSAVLDAAQSLVRTLSDASDDVQNVRVAADRDIAVEVSRINDGLAQVAELNDLILRARTSQTENPALEDQRQQVIDQIADLVPLRQLQRENGTIALYSTSGQLLVDVEPAVFEFTQTEPTTADMTLASGALSGLSVNGQPISVSGTSSSFAGGRLAALFEARDDTAVGAQARLDGLARDLVERFEDPGVDTTLLPGDAGLFTDGGDPLDLADLTGLAARLSVNDAVVPSAGGELWRLRDGINAAVPGPVGDNALLQRMSDAFSATRTASDPILGGAGRSFGGFVGDAVAGLAREAETAEQRAVFSTAQRDALKEAELSQGVDTDQEMQKLLLIEQAYAANARVIQTIDQMIRALLDI